MIPVILGVAGAAILADGLYGASQCEKIDASRNKKNAQAFTQMAVAQEKIKKQKQELEASILKNATRKRGIMTCQMQKFQDVYKTIREIQFESGEGLKELDSFNSNIVAYTHSHIHLGDITSRKLTDKEELYILAVSGLSGSMIQDSRRDLSEARNRLRQSNVAMEHAETVCIASKGMQDRIDMMTTVLTQLGALFHRSIMATEEVIQRNGRIASLYTKQDKEVLANCVNTAQTIYYIIDTPIIDQNSEITQESLKAIDLGRQYLDKINQLA